MKPPHVKLVSLLFVNLLFICVVVYLSFFSPPLIRLVSLFLILIGIVFLLILFAVKPSWQSLLSLVLPAIIFFGVYVGRYYFNGLDYCAAYLEYKIRSADFARDVAYKKNGVDAIFLYWAPWNDSAFSDKVFFYSEDGIEEGREIKYKHWGCPGMARRLHDNYYVFFYHCEY